VETAQLAKLLGMLGAVGGAIAQIAKKQPDTQSGGESAEPLAAELLAAVKDFRTTAEAIIHAMGKHPHLLHVTHHDH
jgi:trimethylamine:corrinoid methyltransferase-like protein